MAPILKTAQILKPVLIANSQAHDSTQAQKLSQLSVPA
jgi:hypothetical protein